MTRMSSYRNITPSKKSPNAVGGSVDFPSPSSSSNANINVTSAMVAVTVDSIYLSRFLSLSFDDDDGVSPGIEQTSTPQRSPLAVGNHRVTAASPAAAAQSSSTQQSPLRGGFTGPLTRLRCELAIVEEKTTFDAMLHTVDEYSSGNTSSASVKSSPSTSNSHISSLPRPVASSSRRSTATNLTMGSSGGTSPIARTASSPHISELIFKPVNEAAATTIHRSSLPTSSDSGGSSPQSPGSPNSKSPHHKSVTIQVSVFLYRNSNQEDASLAETVLLAKAIETLTYDELSALQPLLRNPRTLSLINRSNERVGEVQCLLSFQYVKALVSTSPSGSSVLYNGTTNSSNSGASEDRQSQQRPPSPLTTLMDTAMSNIHKTDHVIHQQSDCNISPPTPQRREPTLANRMQSYSLLTSPSRNNTDNNGLTDGATNSQLSTPTRGSNAHTKQSSPEARAKKQQQQAQSKRRKPFASVSGNGGGVSSMMGSLSLPLPAFGVAAAQAKMQGLAQKDGENTTAVVTSNREKTKVNKQSQGYDGNNDQAPVIEVIHSNGAQNYRGNKLSASSSSNASMFDGPSLFSQISDFLDSLSPGTIVLLGGQFVVTLCLAFYAYVQSQVPVPIAVVAGGGVASDVAVNSSSIVSSISSGIVHSNVSLEGVREISSQSDSLKPLASNLPSSPQQIGSATVTIGGRSASVPPVPSSTCAAVKENRDELQSHSVPTTVSIAYNTFSAMDLVQALQSKNTDPITQSIFVQVLVDDEENQDGHKIQNQCLQWRVGTLKGAMVWDSCQELESWWQFTVFDSETVPYFTLTDLRSKKCLTTKKNYNKNKKSGNTPSSSILSSLQLTKCERSNEAIRWKFSTNENHVISSTSGLTLPIKFRSQMLSK